MSNEILDMYKRALTIAIEKEQDSYKFYEKAMNTVQNPGIKGFFKWLMEEEIRHEDILTNFRDKVLVEEELQSQDLAIKGINDLGIGKYLVPEDIDEDSGYQDALILAMKREEKAVLLFTDLEAATPHTQLKELLGKLKEEEVRHLKRLEQKYDEDILTEN
jgi:rubrerythrin